MAIDTNKNILDIRKKDQYKTVEELFSKSYPSSIYYTLLFFSSLIIASGLLLNNAVILIGGMLVAPLLSPILLIALGITVGDFRTIKDSLLLVFKSALIVILVALVLAAFFSVRNDVTSAILDDSIYAGILYFIVALFSGAAATLAWTRKEVADILPGIAITVSLLPPLGLTGIGISSLDINMFRVSFLTFGFNLVGIVLGSLVVFSLLGFYKTKDVVAKEVKTQEEALEKSEK